MRPPVASARRALAPIVALVVVQLLFASLAIVGKYLFLNGVLPLALAAVRVFFASLLLAALAFARNDPRIARRDWAALAGLSLLGVVFNQLLFLKGLQLTTAVNASILVGTIPIFTLIAAVALQREHFDAKRVLGILVALGGALILLRVDAFDLSDQYNLGNLLVVLNSLSYSFYLVLSRPFLQRYRSPVIVAWTFLLGSLVMVPLGIPQLRAEGTAILTLPVLAGIAWVIVGPSVGAYSLNNYALKRVHASTVATYVFLQILFAVAMAVALLHEPLERRQIIGGLLIVLGVALVSRSEARAYDTNPKTLEPGAA